jgi:hypothetical protein
MRAGKKARMDSTAQRHQILIRMVFRMATPLKDNDLKHIVEALFSLRRHNVRLFMIALLQSQLFTRSSIALSI